MLDNNESELEKARKERRERRKASTAKLVHEEFDVREEDSMDCIGVLVQNGRTKKIYFTTEDPADRLTNLYKVCRMETLGDGGVKKVNIREDD